MKTIQKITVVIALIAMITSCDSNVNVQKELSKPETKTAIMDCIANDSTLCKEMTTTIMNSKNCKMAMTGNHEAMMNMMKKNPEASKAMMCDMMESCENDTAMIHAMCKTMMGNKEMMMGMHDGKCCKKGDKKKMNCKHHQE
jgi:hypothetical protein